MCLFFDKTVFLPQLQVLFLFIQQLKSKIAMGNTCGVDHYQTLMSNHTHQFLQLFLTQNSKTTLSKYPEDIKNRVSKQTLDYEIHINDVFQQKWNVIKNHFGQIKNQLIQKYPGGVDTLEKIQGRSLQQIVLFDEVIKNFTFLKMNAKEQIIKKKNSYFLQIDTQVKQMLSKIVQKKLHIQMYQQLLPQQKQQVITRALQSFKQQIKRNQVELEKQLESKIGLEKYVKILGQSRIQSNLNQEIEKSAIKMNTKKDNLLKITFNQPGTVMNRIRALYY